MWAIMCSLFSFSFFFILSFHSFPLHRISTQFGHVVIITHTNAYTWLQNDLLV